MRLSRAKKQKSRFKSYVTNFNNITIITMALFFLLGIIVGSIILNNISNDNFSEIFSSWSKFLETTSKPNIFESIIKYGKLIAVIWLCGFFKFGAFGIIFALFLKGISIGFTSSFIVASTGSIGIIFAAKLYLLQTAFLIPMCFTVGIIAIKFSLRKISPTYLTNKKYCLLALITLLGILILSLFDTMTT